jgi:hypothetical protein
MDFQLKHEHRQVAQGPWGLPSGFGGHKCGYCGTHSDEVDRMSILPALISHVSREIPSGHLLREAWHSEHSELNNRPDFIPTYFKVQEEKDKTGLQSLCQYLKRLVRLGISEQR